MVANAGTGGGESARQSTNESLDLTSRRRSFLLHAAGLTRLSGLTAGIPEVRIALVDGPISFDPRLVQSEILTVFPISSSDHAIAARHATHVASILTGDSPDLMAICRKCTILSVPVIDDRALAGHVSAHAISRRLSDGIIAAIDAGADIIHLGLLVNPASAEAFGPLIEVLRGAARMGIHTVIPAGNNGSLGVLPPLVVPGLVPVVLGSDEGNATPFSSSNLETARRGLLAPGFNIPGPKAEHSTSLRTGSSFSAAFVTGTFALLRSLYPSIPISEVLGAILRAGTGSPTPLGLVPRRLDGEASLQLLESRYSQKEA
jgi:subtilisin family serine protease